MRITASCLMPGVVKRSMNQAKEPENFPSGDIDRIIAEECETLLESPLFVRSPVLSRLLQFLVDHRLRGGRSAPKAYAIATEALGRSADFDPAVDSYPRVMVGRLRALLDRHYSETPWVHRLRVPQGSYEIIVQHRSDEPQQVAEAAESGTDVEMPMRSASSVRQWLRRTAIFVMILVAAGFVIFAGWRFVGGPDQWLDHDPVPVPLLDVSNPDAGDGRELLSIARALDSKLRDGLRRFDLVNLQSARQDPASQGSRRADFRLDTAIVRRVSGSVDVTFVLNRVADQRAIWSSQLRLEPDDISDFGPIEPIMARIAGDFGVIVRDQLSRQPESFAAGFPCLAQFNRARHFRNSRDEVKVADCLRATIDRDPNNPIALSALSLLRFADWQSNRLTDSGKAAFAEARVLARKSYESGSATSAGMFAMARANFYAGNCGASNAYGNAAFNLHPFDPDLAGHLGLFKIACGESEEGERLLRRSLELDDSYPGIPAVTLAFLLSQKGDDDAALALMNSIASPSNVEPQYLMVRALLDARMGNMEQSRRRWNRLLDYTQQPPDAAPEVVLRQFMIAPAVILRASQALREAGVAPQLSEG